MSQHLTASTPSISCVSCSTPLISRGTITKWKDLPSDGWAEMMDFWHCHKPDLPHRQHGDDAVHTTAETQKVNEGAAAAGRGISATSRLAVERGVGLVGVMDLLFAAEDCKLLNVGNPIHSFSMYPSYLPTPFQTSPSILHIQGRETS